MKRSRWTRLALLVALSACDSNSTDKQTPDSPGAEDPGFGVDLTDPHATYEGRLLVVNTSGAPLPAQLTLDERSYSTDAEGHISVSELPAGETLSARLLADGYVPRTVALSFADIGQGEKRIVMNEVTVLATVKSREGGEVAATSTQVTFKENAIVKADGKPYDGDVVVSLGSHDPASLVLSDYQSGSSFKMRDDFDYDRVPSGYLVAKKKDGTMAIHYPEATFSVDLSDPMGQPLALDPNTPATFKMKLPPITRRLPGDVVDVFTFDEQARQWVPDGTCTVEGSDDEGMACVGTAKHFSARSIPTDSNGTTYCEQFRVVRQNWPDGAVLTMSSESDQAGTWTRAEVNELGERGLCHVSGASKARLKIIATKANGQKYVMTRASAPQAATFDAADISALNDNHQCPKCLVHVIVADWRSMSALPDGDGDGYFAGDESNADCNDEDSAIHPNAPETYCMNYDANCDGKPGKGWRGATLADVKSAGINASEWNATVCKLSCVTPDKTENTGSEGALWDENCDGLLGCPMGTAADASGVCVATKSCTNVTCGANASCQQVSAIETRCACNSGFTGQDGTCLPFNPCATDNGNCAQTCTQSGSQPVCSCGTGYLLNANGKSCDADCGSNGVCNALCNGSDADCAQDAGSQTDSGTLDAGVQQNSDAGSSGDASGSSDAGSIDATTANDQDASSGVPDGSAGNQDASSGTGGGGDAGVPDSGSGGDTDASYDPDAGGPDCSINGICNDICGYDPDCYLGTDAGADAGGPDCSMNGICNDICGYDPDCYAYDAGSGPDCTMNGICNDICGLSDPDCNADPDAGGPDCTMNGICNDICGTADPDCNAGPDAGGPDCTMNGICNDVCGLADPDCEVGQDAGPSCAYDFYCDPNCGYDPDCSVGPDAGAETDSGGPPCSYDLYCDPNCGGYDPDCSGGQDAGGAPDSGSPSCSLDLFCDMSCGFDPDC